MPPGKISSYRCTKAAHPVSEAAAWVMGGQEVVRPETRQSGGSSGQSGRPVPGIPQASRNRLSRIADGCPAYARREAGLGRRPFATWNVRRHRAAKLRLWSGSRCRRPCSLFPLAVCLAARFASVREKQFPLELSQLYRNGTGTVALAKTRIERSYSDVEGV